MSQRKVEWFVGLATLVVGALFWAFAIRMAGRVQARTAAAQTAKPTSSSSTSAGPVVSRAACKAAWRQSRETLTKIHWPNAAEQNALDALLAIPDDTWASDNAKRVLESSRLAACAPDEKGAWALAILPPEADAGAGAQGASSRKVQVEVKRLMNDEKIVFRSIVIVRNESDGKQTTNYDVYEVSSVTLSSVPDMNNDGVPEARLNGTLVTTRSGMVDIYPGIDGFNVVAVKDENGDGRPDVSYSYVVDGGYETQCSGTAPLEYSAPLVAITDAEGVLQFNDRRARDVARTICPSPPASPEKDALCTLIWGFEKRAIPDYQKLEAKCKASNAKADREAGNESESGDDYPRGCTEPPSTEACSQFEPWQAIAQKHLPLALWPPAPGEEVTRSDEENAAIAAAQTALERARKAVRKENWPDAITAYQEAAKHDQPEIVEAELAYARLRNGDAQAAATALDALVDRIVDRDLKGASLYNLGLAKEALGDTRGAQFAFLRSQRVRPTKDATAKLGGATFCPVNIVTGEAAAMSLDDWKKSAGEKRGDVNPPTGAYYDDRASEDKTVDVFKAYRFPGEQREANYKLDGATGRVVRCLVARGCTCSTASPCARGLTDHPAATREFAVFSKATSRRLASVTWPDDLGGDDKFSMQVTAGELSVTGYGCSEKVKLTP
ncbi:MAG TPA: hypothetical protein VNO21_19260 [Polyangiaceae bacterium]|nr:hypothetical protein [Polyangiaceae bacterium]